MIISSIRSLEITHRPDPQALPTPDQRNCDCNDGKLLPVDRDYLLLFFNFWLHKAPRANTTVHCEGQKELLLLLTAHISPAINYMLPYMLAQALWSISVTCCSSLTVFDKAAHGRGPTQTQSVTREVMRLCAHEGKMEGSGERAQKRVCKAGEGRPARG